MNFIKTASISDGDLFESYYKGLTGSNGCCQTKAKTTEKLPTSPRVKQKCRKLNACFPHTSSYGPSRVGHSPGTGHVILTVDYYVEADIPL